MFSISSSRGFKTVGLILGITGATCATAGMIAGTADVIGNAFDIHNAAIEFAHSVTAANWSGRAIAGGLLILTAGFASHLKDISDNVPLRSPECRP